MPTIFLGDYLREPGSMALALWNIYLLTICIPFETLYGVRNKFHDW
jgi:hypothetical protein